MDTFAILALGLVVSVVLGETERPRGVPISKATFYDPSKDFSCLDGSASIKFERVNDDYCDCDDGSDEPGTAACPNGSFHCTNAGHKPKYIPSSRVNDGLCDCCDGTDENDGHVKCANYCKELGRQWKLEMDRERLLLAAGHEIYKEYVHKGQEAKTEKQAKLGQLKLEKDELEIRKDELEGIKNAAEQPEKEAKDRHHDAWEVEKERRKEERNKIKLEGAFFELDANSDGVISVEEMQRHAEFDIDSNEEVSVEEGKEYLDDNDQVNLEVFQEKVWPAIKDIYKADGADGGEERKKNTGEDARERWRPPRRFEQAVPRKRGEGPEESRKKQETKSGEEEPGNMDWDHLRKVRDTPFVEDEYEEKIDDPYAFPEFPSHPPSDMYPEDMERWQQDVPLGGHYKKEKAREQMGKGKSRKIKIKRKPLPKPEGFDEMKALNDDMEEMYKKLKAGESFDFESLRVAEPSDTPPIEDEPPEEHDDRPEDDDDDDDYDEEDEEDHFPPRGVPRGDNGDFDDDSDVKKDKTDEEDPMPDYDEETKALIAAADKARAEYEEVNKKFNDVNQEINEINTLLELDLGPNSEYYPLRGECYEFTDREYTYKLCPFDKTSQRSKHGGMDTNLGTWGHWDGGEDKYNAMKYEKGQNCWHGPDRSCKVKLKCGEENKLTYAAEPNRCEYELEFYTPAACSSPPPASHMEKDEL